jgi:uncharacterized protein
VILVSDSSPLITLARAGHLGLLRELSSQVIIPRAVYDEVVLRGAGLPGAEEVRQSSWIEVRENPSEPRLEEEAACSRLGGGERAAIFLAASLRADLILIDDYQARTAAKRVGLRVAGSIAILEHGAEAGKVVELRSVYLSLLRQGVRFDRRLLDHSLSKLGLPKLEG